MEYFRGDPRAAFLGLSIGQIISIGLVAAGVALFAVGTRNMSGLGEENRSGADDSVNG